MAKAKTSDDIDVIVSEQLDLLSSGKAKEDDYKKAEIITKLIGKQLKKDSLRLSYYAMQKTAPPAIAAFEGSEEKNISPQKRGKIT
jgi:hypothetical protein